MNEQQPIEQPVMPVAVSGASWFTGKVIAILVALLVVAGATGAYFVLSNKTQTSSDKALNNTAQQNAPNGKAGSFQCKDLLPDDKFIEITGISDFKLFEEGRDKSVAGLNQLPGNEGSGDFLVDLGVQQIVCGYAITAKSKEYGSGAFGSDIVYSVVWGGNVANGVAFESARKLFSETRTTTFNGKAYTITPDPAVSQDILGVGAVAYFQRDLLQMLSSNKNYIFAFVGVRDINNSREIQENLAKVIDSNLSRY